MKNFLTRNVALKLLAVVIAIFLWVLVTGESEVVRVLPARMNLQLPEDKVSTGETTGTVSLQLRGPEIVLGGLDPASLSVAIDLRESLPGQQQIALSAQDHVKGVPPGLVVEQITPQTVTVNLEPKMRRAVSVKPRIVGTPSAGCRFLGYDVVPSEILIEGARSEVNALSSIQTEPIDLSGRCDSFMLSVAAMPDKPDVSLVSQKAITVTIRIEPSSRPVS